jgi:hypothetical protein
MTLPPPTKLPECPTLRPSGISILPTRSTTERRPTRSLASQKYPSIFLRSGFEPFAPSNRSHPGAQRRGRFRALDMGARDGKMDSRTGLDRLEANCKGEMSVMTCISGPWPRSVGSAPATTFPPANLKDLQYDTTKQTRGDCRQFSNHHRASSKNVS